MVRTLGAVCHFMVFRFKEVVSVNGRGFQTGNGHFASVMLPTFIVSTIMIIMAVMIIFQFLML